jgi:hypothetical protein
LLVGSLAEVEAWLWMILLTIPLLGLFIESEKRTLQQMIIAFLDEVAARHQLTKVPFGKSDEAKTAASATSKSPA